MEKGQQTDGASEEGHDSPWPNTMNDFSHNFSLLACPMKNICTLILA
jgi:hypothetical protein